MKKLLSLFLVLTLLFVLCACDAEPAETQPSIDSMSIERTGTTFAEDPIWRCNDRIEQTPNTIEVWLNLPKTKLSRHDIILSTTGDGGSYLTLQVEANGKPRLIWDTALEITYDWNFNKVQLRTGKWEHLAIVRDVEEGRIHCYHNGELAQTIKERYSADLFPERPYCIGGDLGDNNIYYCTGQISSVAIFGDARTPEEIASDMITPGAEDLLAYWDLSKAENETIKDQSSLGNDLIYCYRWFEEKEPVTDYAYSFMVIGDTQKVNYHDPNKFHLIYDYVNNSIEEKNVKFVMGLGDITDTSSPEEWTRATAGIYQLDGRVPYSMARGNNGHDSKETFEKAFPMSKYADVIAGSFEGNMRNVYHTFEVGQVKYLVLVLDCSVTDEALDWANEVVAAHPDRNVIVTTHLYMTHSGHRIEAGEYLSDTGNSGYNIWDKLLRKHKNICLLLCGHAPCDQIVTVQSEGDNGNIVTQMLLDPQAVDLSDGSSGLVATFYFSEDGKDVTVEYYSPIMKKYFLTVNQFSFQLDLVD